MKRKKLKNSILQAYISETPDLKSQILSSCINEEQKPNISDTAPDVRRVDVFSNFNITFGRAAAVAVCLFLFVAGCAIGLFVPKNSGESDSAVIGTVIYLDVNPSVELRIDGNDRIIEAIAGNADASIVLAGLELDCIDVNTAIKAIVGSMYVNGYLTESSNSILVSVNSEDKETEDALLGELAEKINTVFENSNIKCAIVAQCVAVDDELRSEASEYGISVGKMHFLNKLIDGCPTLSSDEMEELSGMSINDLNLLYMQVADEGKWEGHEFISGTASVAITSQGALDLVLAQMQKTEADVLESKVFLRPSKSGSGKVAYGVILRLHGDSEIHRYEVDCQSGEVFVILTFATLTSDGIVYRDVLFSAELDKLIP